MNFKPLTNQELEAQIKSAENRLKPTPYCVTDMVIVQLADRVVELESWLREYKDCISSDDLDSINLPEEKK